MPRESATLRPCHPHSASNHRVNSVENCARPSVAHRDDRDLVTTSESDAGLEDVAPIPKSRIPILTNAAADYLIVPNPYLALGADWSPTRRKIIRGRR